MNAAAAFKDGEIVRATLARHEFVPPLACIAEVGVRIDESRHDDPTLSVELDRIRRALKVLPRISSAGGDHDAVARSEPTTFDRADITGGRPDAWALLFERRKREQ